MTGAIEICLSTLSDSEYQIHMDVHHQGPPQCSSLVELGIFSRYVTNVECSWNWAIYNESQRQFKPLQDHLNADHLDIISMLMQHPTIKHLPNFDANDINVQFGAVSYKLTFHSQTKCGGCQAFFLKQSSYDSETQLTREHKGTHLLHFQSSDQATWRWYDINSREFKPYPDNPSLQFELEAAYRANVSALCAVREHPLGPSIFSQCLIHLPSQMDESIDVQSEYVIQFTTPMLMELIRLRSSYAVSVIRCSKDHDNGALHEQEIKEAQEAREMAQQQGRGHEDTLNLLS